MEKYARPTKPARILEQMDQVIPWTSLGEVIEPHYFKRIGNGGRPPIPLERMLRIDFLQRWFNLSDPTAEASLYDLASIRRFASIDLGAELAPDETTICKFRHLLVRNALGKPPFKHVQRYLHAQGFKVSTSTIVDATIINAPSSTKNQHQQRDPDMRQTRKGKQWYFGMKAHIGVDSRTRLIHSVEVTAANVADCRVLPELLHGNETRVCGDQAYRGQGDAVRQKAPQALDFTNQRYSFRGVVDDTERATNRTMSKVRSKVEHVFAAIKLRFGFTKVRYRGLAKNLHRL